MPAFTFSYHFDFSFVDGDAAVANIWLLFIIHRYISYVDTISTAQRCASAVFSARCNIYISRLCYDVSVRLSVRLSVTFVHCGHSVQWIQDIFACLDRWMSLLLTDNASPGSSDGMLPGFLVEGGGV